MKVMISGTWHIEKAEKYKYFAEKIGEELAKRGHILISGAGTGVSKLVVDSYRKNNGKKYIAVLTSKENREKVGEELGPEPDEILDTGMDYPCRNIELVKASDAMIALPGGVGALTEIIHASCDYNKKVAVLDEGPLADMIEHIPKLREKVFLTSNINEVFEFLEKN